MRTNLKTRMALTALILAGILAGAAQGEFQLFGDEQITVNNSQGWGELYENSQATIVPGGSLEEYLMAFDYSKVKMTGGYVSYLATAGSSTSNIYGGFVDYLEAYESSTIMFHGKNFSVDGALYFDGNRVLGDWGNLNGQWLDGTPWSVYINLSEPTATIKAVPEPCTLLLLGLGAAIAVRKQR